MRDNSLEAELMTLRVPMLVDQFAGALERYPDAHESQIQAAQAWRLNRAERIAAHAARIQRNLHCHSHPNHACAGQGRCRATWCVELQRQFTSLAAAGRFVDRAPSNILQAIRSRNRCGRYHWAYFDANLHHEGKAAGAFGELAGTPESGAALARSI